MLITAWVLGLFQEKGLEFHDGPFISNVEKQFTKDTDLIVACQKGLRSLAACDLLCNAGFTNVFWVQGGLEAAEEEDLQKKGPEPFSHLLELEVSLSFLVGRINKELLPLKKADNIN